MDLVLLLVLGRLFLDEKVARIFPAEPTVERSNAKPILILFNTQKTALSMTAMSCSELRQLTHVTVFHENLLIELLAAMLVSHFEGHEHGGP